MKILKNYSVKAVRKLEIGLKNRKFILFFIHSSRFGAT